MNTGLQQFKHEIKDLSNKNSNKFSKSVLEKNTYNQVQLPISIQENPITFKQNYKIVPIKNYDIF